LFIHTQWIEMVAGGNKVG